jgi:ABC-type polysaccharide/polyol phosphate export permease
VIRLLSEFARHRSAVLTLIQYNLKSTVATTRLGVLWWVIDPLVMMGIYYFLVRVVFERGGPDYHLFVLCGIVPWQYFARSVRLSSRSIASNRALLRQIGMPIAVIVAVPVLVQLVFACFGVGVIMAWNHGAVGPHSLAVVPLLLLLAAFSYGAGLLLAVCEVHYPDTNAILGYVLRIGFLLSPVLYPVSRILEEQSIPEWAKVAYQANPLAWIISGFRDVLLTGTAQDWNVFAVLLIGALAVVQAGLACIRAAASRIVKMI